MDWGGVSFKKIKIIIAILFFSIIAISYYRIYPKSGNLDFLFEFFLNLFHSFYGGYFLYAEHGESVFINKIDAYSRAYLVGVIPGIDVVISTIVDKIFDTSFSNGHFESIFWENHIFRHVKLLDVDMNSYFTGIVFFKIVGYASAAMILFIIFYGATKNLNFGGRVSQAWLVLFGLSFDKYFINQHPGFSLLFLVAFTFGVMAIIHDFLVKLNFYKART